jgi:hypothetical protein
VHPDIDTDHGVVLTSTHIGLVPIPDLPDTAHHSHLFPDLQSSSLMWLVFLCVHGHEAQFTATDFAVSGHSAVLLTGDVISILLAHFMLFLSLPIMVQYLSYWFCTAEAAKLDLLGSIYQLTKIHVE